MMPFKRILYQLAVMSNFEMRKKQKRNKEKDNLPLNKTFRVSHRVPQAV